MNVSTLYCWYGQSVAKKKRKGRPEAKASASTAEERLAELERENRKLKKQVEDLEIDREILKKAAAFFAKESE